MCTVWRACCSARSRVERKVSGLLHIRCVSTVIISPNGGVVCGRREGEGGFRLIGKRRRGSKGPRRQGSLAELKTSQGAGRWSSRTSSSCLRPSAGPAPGQTRRATALFFCPCAPFLWRLTYSRCPLGGRCRYHSNGAGVAATWPTAASRPRYACFRSSWACDSRYLPPPLHPTAMVCMAVPGLGGKKR